ncbi:MAG: hypothetical protein H7835_19315 [Magnetococcus sp. XQGC-1]
MITTHPSEMSPEARLTEAAAIFAIGIKRMKEKQKTENFLLDNSPNQWLYGRKTPKGGRR